MAQVTLNDLGDRVAFCDPAGGKSRLKTQAARSAISVVAADALGHIFVLDSWGERCSTDALVERIFRIHEQFRLRVFGVEANAMQSLFGDMVLREARHRGIRLPLVPVHQPTTIEKDFRLRTTLQPVIAEGRLFLQEGQHELRAEIEGFPQLTTKDLIDSLASAVVLLPRRAVARQQAEDVDGIARYLRQSGVAPRIIEQRLSALRGTPDFPSARARW